eukprot:TRINITY_DN67279_c7_g1_i1.p1 TRINITY_DN67279_c7_g1~~TRINITY_DN67279_c7_g1_i1.p1  ORF type:complete len:318 (+),score=20.24 TRINITY_DN67279_c7_g1_i1:21-974(+)
MNTTALSNSPMADTPPHTLYFVLDPANRIGKVAIPAEMVKVTVGARLYDIDSDTATILCTKYQRRCCRKGSKCKRLHANRDFIAKLRTYKVPTMDCCHHHVLATDEEFNDRNYPQTVILQVSPLVQFTVPPTRLAYTAGLQRELEELKKSKKKTKITITREQTCSLHQQYRCLQPLNCTKIHICREWWSCAIEGNPQPSLQHPDTLNSPPTLSCTKKPMQPGYYTSQNCIEFVNYIHHPAGVLQDEEEEEELVFTFNGHTLKDIEKEVEDVMFQRFDPCMVQCSPTNLLDSFQDTLSSVSPDPSLPSSLTPTSDILC